MKRHFTHLVTTLLAGACLALASCSDSGSDEPKLPQPNFPAPVSATVAAGDTYTITIEPNQDWQVEIPTELSSWFWIQDGTQKVYSKRGSQGKYEISIGVSDQEEFDQPRVCTVTMIMAGKKETILTLTRGTLERGLSLYPCQIDADGLFAYDPEGVKGYMYDQTPATTFELAWPQGQTGFSRPVMVQANFDWAISDMPEWLETPSTTTGTAGTEVELRCVGDVARYPLDGGKGTLVFIDQSNHDAKYEVEVTIPGCRDRFEVELVSELEFDENALFWSESNTSWLPGSIFGSYQSIKGSKIYIFSEIDQWGTTSLSAEPSDIDWVILTEDAWNDSQEGGVVQTVNFTVGVKANTGDARKGYVVVLPPAVAKEITDPNQLIEMDFKPEYQQYVFGTITQKPTPGSIQPLTPDDMASIGAKFEKLPSSSWLLREFDVADAYKLTYTKAWSSDAESTLVFSREYTGYKCYDFDANPIPDADNWLSVTKTAKGSIVHMDKEAEGFIVFYDAAGNFAVIDCLYDSSIILDEVKVEFVYPDVVRNAELQQITSGKYYDQYAELGAPIWNLIYTSADVYTASIRVPAHSKAVTESPWLKSEAGANNEFTVYMNSETSAEGVLLLQTADGVTVLVLVCTLTL